MRRLVLGLAVAAVVASTLGSCTGDGSTPPADLALGPRAQAGADVARQRGCAGCHSNDGSRGSGPSWKGVWGSEVRLASGDTVTGDEAYLRRAITDPRADVVDGYANIMPIYDDLSTDDVASLVAYICMLGDGTDADTCEAAGG